MVVMTTARLGASTPGQGPHLNTTYFRFTIFSVQETEAHKNQGDLDRSHTLSSLRATSQASFGLLLRHTPSLW